MNTLGIDYSNAHIQTLSLETIPDATVVAVVIILVVVKIVVVNVFVARVFFFDRSTFKIMGRTITITLTMMIEKNSEFRLPLPIRVNLF